MSTLTDEMRVVKRNGNIETVSFDKILRRIKNIGQEANIKINFTQLAMKVIDQLYDKITTTQIDTLTADQCASMSSIHYDYGTMAAHIVVSNHHKNTSANMVDVIRQLYHFEDKHGNNSPLVSEQLYNTVINNADIINYQLDFDRDYLFDYFGFKTLEKTYLMRVNGKVVERPQHMWMRVSLGIHGDDLQAAFETYHLMSQKYFTHATPTLFNSGTPRPQMSSCFLIGMENDSIDGIYSTLKDCALISKWAGGIGLHIHNIRASGSHIRGTNGNSNGIVPMLRVFNNTAKYVDQCLSANTTVYTKSGPAPIKSVVPGVEVICDDGLFRPVKKVVEYPEYTGELYRIVVNRQHVDVTDMHPFYVKTDSNSQPEYVEAKNLKTGDLVAFPVPEYERDLPNLTETDCHFYGIFMVCGGKITQTQQGIMYFIDLNQVADKQYLHDFLTNYFTNHCHIQHKYHKDDNRFTYKYDAKHMPFSYSMLFDENCVARVFPAMHYLPANKSQALLDGINRCIKSLAQLRNSVLHSVNLIQLRLRNTAVHYVPIDNIERIDATETCVMDLEIDSDNAEHHNFLTSCGLVHNGGGKRHGSFAIYLEPWHADIELFLEMRKNHGDEELKARDLFYALWIPDLFMERVKADGQWTLMCPDECPGLADVYGDAFVSLYTCYESEGKGRKTVKARDLWFKVLDAQMETGTPYLCYKDAANKKSNQKNIGTIKSSNLCSEVIEYSDDKETAVCNLASIGLPTFVDPVAKSIDYAKLADVTQVVTRNLNKVIDINYYPTEKTRTSNMRHRPIGIGVQGLADVFMLMDIPFHSEEAKRINQTIFETIYYGALKASNELAFLKGKYETFDGSPASEGLLQFDLWGKSVNDLLTKDMFDWTSLKEYVQCYGLRNSLLLAPMPTASTSQILGFNECFEPFTSNIYSRRTLAGEFVLTNKYLMRDLIAAGLWSKDLKNSIIANQGSVQHIDGLSQHLKNKYKTVWEIPMRHVIDMAADRGAFICQSQSLNLWMEDPNYNALTSMHFYAWSKGLKTGIYYLRRRARHRAQQFTIEPEKRASDEEGCTMCSA